ncbi:MAG: glycosyltransferase family 9 protein [Nitrospira sp.]|nr:glycosyltransferase family 9 protein [Nitrospira sp.]
MNRNIVIIHPGALGDVLLAVPAMKKLAVRFSGHTIVLIARAPVSRLLAECCVIDEWISIESQACAGLFTRFGCPSMELQSCFERCDAAVAWAEDTDGSLANVLGEFGISRVWIQSPFSSDLNARHQRDRFLETVGETGTDALENDGLHIPDYLLEKGRVCLQDKGISPNGSLVFVHPGSGSVHKCLSSEKLASIVQKLQQREMSPVLLEGPADQGAAEGVLKLLSKKPPVLRDLDLPLLAGILAHAELYLGHDSGLTHLAALLGVRTVSVFGPTDHHRWAPYGEHVAIVRGASCVCPSWEAVKQCQEKPCLAFPIEEILTALKLQATA